MIREMPSPEKKPGPISIVWQIAIGFAGGFFLFVLSAFLMAAVPVLPLVLFVDLVVGAILGIVLFRSGKFGVFLGLLLGFGLGILILISLCPIFGICGSMVH